jgi:hypothetical protein
MAYTIDFTDKTKQPIVLDEMQTDNTTDITLFGRKRLAYGQELQENLLHILENFACPEDSTNPGNPDLNKSYDGIFQHVVEGQFWYNSTKNVLNYWDGTHWIPLARQDSVAANWGIISDGQFLPNPVSEITGKVFNYSECVWIVSPFTFPQKIDFFQCSTDANAQVTSKYRIVGNNDILPGMANYLIVGIAGNVNQLQPTIQPSHTPTPTPTSSTGQSPTPTPTLTASHTPTASTTPSPTPAVSTSPSPTPSRTPFPSGTPQVTPQPSPTPSVSLAPLVLTIPANSFVAACTGLSTQSCAPTKLSTLTATGGTAPYTYTYQLVSGDNLNAFGAFGTPTSAPLTVNWTGPNANIGTTDDGTGTPRYTSVFQFKVTDATGQVAFTNSVTVQYRYIHTD